MNTSTVQPDPSPLISGHTRSVVLNAFGGIDALEVGVSPMPVPGPGQVRVRTLAASVQFTDVLIRTGRYPDLKTRPPFCPGYDIVGEVDAVGPGVEPWRVGDRVADLTMIGSYTHHRLLDADRVVPVPTAVDPAQAVALVLSWMTAYQLLHRFAHVAAGQSVLIHGGAGAVGQPLLALGAMAGLTMYATCRAEHADLVASYGATPIDYRNEDFTEVLASGVDIVFDGIAEDGFRKSWRVIKPGGFLAAYGLSAAINAGFGLLRTGLWFIRPFLWNLLPGSKRAGFYSITAMRKRNPTWFAEDLGTLMELLAAGKIAPRVAQRIQLADVPQAHRQLESGGLDGKIVIVPT